MPIWTTNSRNPTLHEPALHSTLKLFFIAIANKWIFSDNSSARIVRVFSLSVAYASWLATDKSLPLTVVNTIHGITNRMDWCWLSTDYRLLAYRHYAIAAFFLAVAILLFLLDVLQVIMPAIHYPQKKLTLSISASIFSLCFAPSSLIICISVSQTLMTFGTLLRIGHATNVAEQSAEILQDHWPSQTTEVAGVGIMAPHPGNPDILYTLKHHPESRTILSESLGGRCERDPQHRFIKFSLDSYSLSGIANSIVYSTDDIAPTDLAMTQFMHGYSTNICTIRKHLFLVVH